MPKDMVRNRRILEWLCEEVERARDIDIAVLFAQAAVRFAISKASGYYSLPALERPFLILGDSLRMPRPTNSPKGSLHVMTESYPTGGHTQVVAQWFRLCPDDEPANLLLTEQKSEDAPRFLREAVEERGGRIFSLWDENSDRDFRRYILRTSEISTRALFMRSLALVHRRVFLSHHMHDPLPITAFGHKDFSRPVFVINHADHLFWLGRSVTDAVLDIHETGRETTKLFRGDPPSVHVPALLEMGEVLSISKREARERCGLPQDAVVILSVGSPWKFFPAENYNFQDVLRKSLESVPEALHVIVGPSPDSEHWHIWSPLLEIAGERLRMPGRVPRAELDCWLKAADIFLCSFPFGGGCALLDAVQYHLPVTGLRHVPGATLDYLSRNDWFLDSEKELVNRIAFLGAHPEARRELAEAQRAMVDKSCGKEAWLAGAKQVLGLPPVHNVTQSWEAPAADRAVDRLMARLHRGTAANAEIQLLHFLASMQVLLDREEKIRLMRLLKFIESVGLEEK